MAEKRSQPSKENQPSPELEHVLRNFVACNRCSFFLAGYRVIYGLENLETAAGNQADGWLSLTWSEETRQLLQSSYGGRLDTELYYYDGQCPVCRRRFTYQAAEEGEQPQFRIGIKQS